MVTNLKRKQSSESNASVSTRIPSNGTGSAGHYATSTSLSGMDDKFRALRLDLASTGLAGATPGISDSGYISHVTHNGDSSHVSGAGGQQQLQQQLISPSDPGMPAPNLISEKAIHAMLRPHSFRGKRIFPHFSAFSDSLNKRFVILFVAGFFYYFRGHVDHE